MSNETPSRQRPTRQEQKVLDLIATGTDQLTVADLAQRLDSTPNSIKVTVYNLRKKGWKITSTRQRKITTCHSREPETYRLEGEL